MAKHTNRVKVLSPCLTISWSDLDGTRTNYPTQGQKTLLLNAAASAREIMRTAVRDMDRVVFFRRPEGQPFTSIMNYHFGLSAARAATLAGNKVDKKFEFKDVGTNDRRSILNKIRMGMLSISFHLNTGVYIIDNDNDERTIKAGAGGGVKGQTSAVHKDVAGNVQGFEEGYISHKGSTTFQNRFVQADGTQVFETKGRPHAGVFSAYKNGEIHLSFKYLHSEGYTAEDAARVLIHEAAHKYWAVADHAYAHQQAAYRSLTHEEALDNADSYAWAALSLNAGGLIWGHYSQGNPVQPKTTTYA